MIAYVDVAMLGHIKTLFPNYTVAWGAPEVARSVLSNAAIAANAANNTLNPNNTVGIPGVCVWRNGTVERTDFSNLPQGDRGWPMGRFQQGAIDPNTNITPITLSGTITTGDIISIVMSSAAFVLSDTLTQTVSYTVLETDIDIPTLALSIAAQINADPVASNQVTAYSTGAVLKLVTPSLNPTSYDYAQGSNTEILTIGSTVNKSVAGEYNRTLARHVKVEYILTAYTQKYKDRDFFEREAWFSDIYKTLDTVIPSFTDTVESTSYTWPILRDGGPASAYNVNTDTGAVIWLKSTQRLNVFSLWAKSINIPPIESIVVKYEQMMNGSPILLDDITILPTIPDSDPPSES
jgi:hypothetical protein